MKDITIRRVGDERELHGIKVLQDANRIALISPDEAQREGFVTASYSSAFLREMHVLQPSVIAIRDEVVVGYALVADARVRGRHDLLDGLFEALDAMTWQGNPPDPNRVVLVGQLCVAKPYRGMGLPKRMYQYFKDCLSSQYEVCVTDVSEENPRSLKVHLRCGFHIADTLSYGGSAWHVVVWDWRDSH